ncbi:MAG: hypothetical protein GKR97_07125 [Rhizobiaceae bacterium]|nr:hypothetical protein [Rhizobiaceae bacterium]
MTKSTFLMMFLMLTACSTSYQEMGLTGGVTSQRIYNNTYRIKARGNGWTEYGEDSGLCPIEVS